MNESPKILLVGCGTVSKLFYTPALDELCRTDVLELQGVVDTNVSSADQISNKLSTVSYSNLDEGLKENPDLTIIATPPSLHKQQTIQALESGSHVLCEKPLANNSQDAREMANVARREKKTIAVGHYKRFFPAAEQIKSFIEDQSLGKLQKISLQEGGKFGWPIQNDSFFRKEMTPGGVLYDIGVHAIDLLFWWLGAPILKSYSDDSLGGLEASAKLNLEWADKSCVASLYFSRDWPTRNEWVFEFQYATLAWTVNEADRLDLIYPGSTPYRLRTSLLDQNKTPCRNHPQSFTKHLMHVIESTQNRSPLRTSINDSIKTLELIENCYFHREN